MDASTTCALVTVTPFSDYSQVVNSTGNSVVDFTVSSSVTSKNTSYTTPSNYFTNYFMSMPNKPSLGGKPSIVTGYLGYSSQTMRYRTAASPLDTKTIINQIVSDSNLCSSDDIFNSNLYTPGGSLTGMSLAALYQAQPISPESQAQITMLENRNLNFFSFFTYEYCYYHTMYSFLLTEYFNEYASPSYASKPNIAYLRNSSNIAPQPGTSSAAQASRLDALVYTLALVNSRMNDMRTLLSGIQSYYSDSLNNLNTLLNNSTNIGGNIDAEKKITALISQTSSIKNAKDASDFTKGVMEYTSEKNRYSNILLGIYAFLNIAAIAIIFNIKE